MTQYRYVLKSSKRRVPYLPVSQNCLRFYGLVVLFQRLQTTDIREPVPLQMYRHTLILSIYQSRISNCSDKKREIDICIIMGT